MQEFKPSQHNHILKAWSKFFMLINKVTVVWYTPALLQQIVFKECNKLVVQVFRLLMGIKFDITDFRQFEIRKEV